MPLRVLIVRVGAMGDVLHALPAVTALRKRFPEARIGWAIEPAWASLLDAEGAAPLVDRVHRVPTKAWKRRAFHIQTAREIAALRRELRAERYDVCVDLQGSIRSAVVGWMAGARRFIGPAEPWERGANWLYGERVSVARAHVIEQACELLGAGVGVGLQPIAARLPRRANLPTDAAPIGFLVPTAGWGAKQWPAAQFRELAERMHAAGMRVLVNASGAHEPIAREIAAGGAAEVFPCGLEDLAAIVQRTAVVVGGDTGPVHLAAALGVPVVALFGPTDPARTGPQGFPGSRVVVLRDPASRVDHRRHPETEAGLARISVDVVMQAVSRQLNEPLLESRFVQGTASAVPQSAGNQPGLSRGGNVQELNRTPPNTDDTDQRRT